MARSCASCAAFRSTLLPGRRSGDYAATRTTQRARLGAASACSMCTAKRWRRTPVEDRILSGRQSRLQQCRPGGLQHRRRGFTFVELMVVITIIVILISMAIPIYNRSIVRARESVLHNNLHTLREVIDQYTYDKQKAPQQLQDLVSEGYLLKLPIDPMVGNNQSWRTIMEDAA